MVMVMLVMVSGDASVVEVVSDAAAVSAAFVASVVVAMLLLLLAGTVMFGFLRLLSAMCCLCFCGC